MPDFPLSVELTAKIDGLRDNFNAAVREVGKLDKDTKAKLSSIDKGFADLANSVETNFTSKIAASTKKTSTSVSRDLASMAKATSAAGGGISAGANKAGLALTDLSRIANDAPFGFIGIQNNIGPLVESFGRLKAETGSTGGALKALVGSLSGPAGLGFAISAVSAGILFYQQYQQKANKETKDAKKNTDDYVDSLDQLDQVQVRGAQNALRERTELDALYKVTQDVTLSNKQRNEAVDELQNKYPEYFKNLDDEIIKNGGAKEAYDRLSQSILATARARAAQDLITKNASRQLENEQKIRDAEAVSNKLLLQQQTALSKLRSGDPGSARFNAREAENAEKGLAVQAKIVNDLKTDTNILSQRNLQLETAITDQIKQGADLTGKVGTTNTTRTKDIRTVSDVMKELNVDLKQTENQFNQTFGGQIEDKVKAYQKAIDELIKLGLNPASDAVNRLKASQNGLFDGMLKDVPALNTNVISSGIDPIKVAPVLDVKPIIIGKSELDRALEDLKTKKDQFLSLGNTFGLASSALSDGFAAIGEGLANGGNVIEAFGQVVVNAFANFLAELGRQTIAEGLFHIAKGLAYATNPFTAALAQGELTSGAGLVAAGGLLSLGGGLISGGGNNRGNNPQVQSPTAFAKGGVIYGPTLGLMGEYAGAKNNPEVVAPLSSLKSILSEVALENGSSQLAPNNRTNNTNNVINNYNRGSDSGSNSVNNYGGGNGFNNQPIVFSPTIEAVTEYRIKGSDILVVTKLAEAKQKRKT